MPIFVYIKLPTDRINLQYIVYFSRNIFVLLYISLPDRINLLYIWKYTDWYVNIQSKYVNWNWVGVGRNIQETVYIFNFRSIMAQF